MPNKSIAPGSAHTWPKSRYYKVLDCTAHQQGDVLPNQIGQPHPFKALTSKPYLPPRHDSNASLDPSVGSVELLHLSKSRLVIALDKKLWPDLRKSKLAQRDIGAKSRLDKLLVSRAAMCTGTFSLYHLLHNFPSASKWSIWHNQGLGAAIF